MTVTSLDKDVDNAILTIVSEYSATVADVWRLWADPRQLERWWGPPSHPATVTGHDLSPGGTVQYFMTGPDCERYQGGWRFIEAMGQALEMGMEEGVRSALGQIDALVA